MSHTSGVSGWDPPFTVEDMYDWQTATTRLAGQAPWWEPGTASGYHANNQGHLVGELVRPITGKPLKQFVVEDLAPPLRADLQIGAREQDWGRIADVVPPRRWPSTWPTYPRTARSCAPSPDQSPTPARRTPPAGGAPIWVPSTVTPTPDHWRGSCQSSRAAAR